MTTDLQMLSVGDISLSCAIEGEGPTVVLLHGFPQSHRCWRLVTPLLVKAGFRVVAPDLRGYGQSTKHGPYDINTLTNDVVGLIRALGVSKATVVGHDWGGAIAWHLAAHVPEVVERLVVTNCPHPAVFSSALTSSLTQLRRSWYMFFFQLPWLPELLISRKGGDMVGRSIRAASIDRTHMTRDELRPYGEAMQHAADVSAPLGYYRAIMRRPFRTKRMAAAYPLILPRTLLVWGKKDPALGYDALVPKTVERCRDLEIRTLDDVGHFVPEEAPEALADAIIEFLHRPNSQAA